MLPQFVFHRLSPTRVTSTKETNSTQTTLEAERKQKQNIDLTPMFLKEREKRKRK